MANAKFKITGSTSADQGYDATYGDVLQLQLENQPQPDVFKCQYSIGKATAGAPTPTFSTSLGLANPVGSIVELTMPGAGIHAYEVICTVNNGTDAAGKIRPEYTFSRIVAIRSNEGLRKIFAAETTEYDKNQGWAEAVNEIVETIDTISGGGGGGSVTSVNAIAPVIADDSNPAVPVISMPAATPSSNGYMSGSDKAFLDSLAGGGTVVSIGSTAPITVNNTIPSTPIIGISPATGLAAGSLSSADKAKLDAATSLPTPNTLVLRDGAGGTAVTTLVTDYITSNGNLVLSADGFGEVVLDGASTGRLLVPMGINTSSVQLDTAVDLIRTIPMHWKSYWVSGAPSWIPTSTNNARQAILDGESELYADFYLPNGVTLTFINVRILGGGLISDPVPANPPIYTVIRKSMNTGAQTIIGTLNDPLGAGYRAQLRWNSIDCSSHVVDDTIYRYYVKIAGEYGTNAQLGMELVGIQAQYTMPVGYSIGID